MKVFGIYSKLQAEHAQRETPYWDYKQSYDLKDIERNLSAQYSWSAHLSPLLGNTLGETWASLRESQTEKGKKQEKIRNWERRWQLKKDVQENLIELSSFSHLLSSGVLPGKYTKARA